MQKLEQLGFVEPLKKYIQANRPFLGICVGMQCLYLGSSESPSSIGLGIIEGNITKFDNSTKSVPHIGWNGAQKVEDSYLVSDEERFYFVHSYAANITAEQVSDMAVAGWAHTLTTYGDETFVSSISRGNICATQFHPEKSGEAGLKLLSNFILANHRDTIVTPKNLTFPLDLLTRRIIACLDVRSNDAGDLVVTKGDQYDVKESSGQVRNLGKPVELAQRYYEQGADEVTFLNITSFRDCPLEDTPMLEVLKQTSKLVFVPLTIGGGIRDMPLRDGSIIKAIEVAGEYFRSGADKISIGSDAVYITEAYLNGVRESNAISSIASHYGSQAVVISVDPKRVYVTSRESTNHATVATTRAGPSGELFWY